MKRYELAVIRRAVGRVAQAVGKHRVIVTADRGFADVALCTLLSQLGLTCIIGSRPAQTSISGPVVMIGQAGVSGNERHRVLALWPIARVAHNAYGYPRIEPETQRATGACGIW